MEAFGRGINVNIWDFAGHTVTHAVHQFFLSERCLYLIVYDGRSEERNRLKYWLDHMKNYGGASSAIILVNRRDHHQVEIPINQLKEDYNIVGLYDFSIQDDMKALSAFRKDIANFIQHNPSWKKQEIPNNYYNVKEEIETLFARDDDTKVNEHITIEKFREIALRNEIRNTDSLIVSLHQLGVSLWYPGLENFNTLILNPEWISHGVYQIINWVHNARHHSVTLEEFRVIFTSNAERYPSDKCEFLFTLIKHYKLAYETAGKKTLIFPHLMVEDRPEYLPAFPPKESLTLRYKADQPLPPHTISRFIVEHNDEIIKQDNQAIVWRYGVALTDGKGTTALVREDNRILTVSVKGTNKTEYISSLRATLNKIFESYKSQRPSLQYQVERDDVVLTRSPDHENLWLGDRQISNLITKALPYYDDVTGEPVSLEKLARNFNITINHIQAKTVILGNRIQNTHDQSLTQNFHMEFKDCSVNLQGSLNALADMLRNTEPNEALEIREIAQSLEEAEQCENPEQVKKKGIAQRLQSYVQDLGDEKSALSKSIKGLKRGASIARQLVEGYNKLAPLLNMDTIQNIFGNGL